MQRTYLSIFIILFALISPIVQAQSKTDQALQKKIIGTWKFKQMKYITNEKTTEEEKSMTSLIDVLSEQMGSVTYDFQKKGIYKSTGPDGETQGTWSVKNKLLYMQSNEASGQAGEGAPFTVDAKTLTFSGKATEGLTIAIVLERK